MDTNAAANHARNAEPSRAVKGTGAERLGDEQPDGKRGKRTGAAARQHLAGRRSHEARHCGWLAALHNQRAARVARSDALKAAGAG